MIKTISNSKLEQRYWKMVNITIEGILKLNELKKEGGQSKSWSLQEEKDE